TIGIDDITFPGEPMFGISNIGKAIQDFTKDGNFYFTSTGNFYDNAYQSIFQAYLNADIPDFVPDPDAVAHVFGSTNGSEDIYQRFRVKSGETYMIVLQWDDDFASQDNILGAKEDLDFWVVDDQERLLVGNNYYNDNDTEIAEDGKDPIEYITFRATADGEANFMITSANGDPGALPFRYIIFVANSMQVLEHYDGAPTMSGHTLTPEALAIGAVDFRDAAAPEPQPFSSFGGVLEGALSSDIAAAQVALSSFDGVNTNVGTIGQNEVDGVPIDGDIYKNFFGTSASVVHVAAAFALAKSAIPSWYGTENSVDILQLFKDNATKVGFEDQLGAGVVNAANTFKQIAAQTAFQISLAVNEGQVNEDGEPLVLSADPILVTLTGKYFPEAPEDPNDPANPDPLTVYFGDGEDRIELEIDKTTRTDTELVVTVPPFIGNPNVVVNTAPLVGTVNNGGDSNALPIIEDGRLALRITASEVEIEYGQAYEDKFDFTIEGLPAPYTEGLPDDKNLNEILLELGLSPLPDIVFDTNVDPADLPYPKVFNYTIFPCFDDTGNCSGTKVTELDDYIVTFKGGPFIVNKKDLKIEPNSIVTTYGETITLDFIYDYVTTGITDNEHFKAAISEAHKSTYDTEFNNNLAVINGFKALVNDEQVSLLNLLEDRSWIGTKTTIANGFKALVNQGNLLDLDTSHFDDYSDYLNNGFKALVNDFKALVNSEDLFNGVASFGSIQNGFKALVNSPDSNAGGDDDADDYSKVFAIVYDGDGDAPITEYFSLNLITGLDAFEDPEEHYSFPGAFLSPIANNFNITYGRGIISVKKAELTATIGDLVIEQGTKLEEIDTSLISYTIDGYVYDETVEDVFPIEQFPEGIPYSFKNANGVEYTEGATGVYFIRIKQPQKNYKLPLLDPVLDSDKIGVLYVNPTGDHLRKIRTYLDCVEENFGDPDGLNYIAHYRYINPNEETIYILEGPENQLTGPAAYSGELPFMFLPGENTFQIRFDGNTLKWELTSRDSTHKSSTTSNANANSSRCNAGFTTEDFFTNSFIIYPNPVNGILFIDQHLSERVTLDVFDLYGILHTSRILDGRSGSVTHEIDMSGYYEGMYILRFSMQDDVQVYSVIKE
ncbi:MAG: T9SS type A sorting domain-containing protein, partial [Flavobacteriaceae bacterium]|nr:T9SS type A sorting domain-containing protein [Flavobacteriaceae bacterium]